MNLRFPKSEKLKSAKTIERLFKEGKSITSFPLKMIFIENDSLTTTQAAFAVPKRNFKTAVTRNRIKRQIRESYRLHKQLLTTNNGKSFSLLFLYISKEIPQYIQFEKAIPELLKKLNNQFSKTP